MALAAALLVFCFLVALWAGRIIAINGNSLDVFRVNFAPCCV